MVALVTAGALRQGAQDAEGAEACYRAALAANPDEASAWQNLAVLAIESGHDTAAIVMARRAVDLRPRDVYARVNLGNILWRSEHYQDADEQLSKALELDPTLWMVHQNIGLLKMLQGDYQSGIASLTQSFSLCPPDKREIVAADLGIAVLYTGDLAGGFQLVQREWKKTAAPFGDLPIPEWDGVEDIAGKRLLVYHNHGFGDTLQFARFLPELRKQGAEVTLAVPRPLYRLFERSHLVDQVVGWDEPIPDADFKMPLSMLLSRQGVATLDDLAQWPCPYFRTGHRQPRRKTMRFRVGVIWSANQQNRTGQARSVPLEALLPLALLKGVQLYGLQVGPAVRDIDRLGARALIHDLSSEIRDFADLADTMCEMDLIVSADTGPLHLAGALAVPCIGILSWSAADWRWLERERDDSPWYPTMRLVRQPQPGDWASAVERASYWVDKTIWPESMAAE